MNEKDDLLHEYYKIIGKKDLEKEAQHLSSISNNLEMEDYEKNTFIFDKTFETLNINTKEDLTLFIANFVVILRDILQMPTESFTEFFQMAIEATVLDMNERDKNDNKNQ